MCKLSHAASIQDLVDAFSANSNTLLLSETEYDGEDLSASQLICGDCKPLRQKMLNTLLSQATYTDWALPAILDMEYIKPLEEYCEKTKPCDVPLALPKLLSLIGKTSEDALDRICGSSIPSFLLKWMVLAKNDTVLTEIGNCLLLFTSTPRSSSAFLAHHKTAFLAFVDHCTNKEFSLPHITILAQLSFSPHLDVSKMALNALSSQSGSDSETYSFLRTLEVPSGSTDISSELVPFAGRLCSTLAEHVSEMKSLFAESSASDGTISALSVTLPSESPLLTGNTVFERIDEGLFLLHMLFIYTDIAFVEILIDGDFVPLLKSTIITCLDLIEHEKNESICPPSDRTDLAIRILNNCWDYTANSLGSSHKSLHRVCESAFCDVPQLCSLLERTCRHSSPTHPSHVRMIINISGALHHFVPRMLEENLVERVIDTFNPMVVPTTHRKFHMYLITAIINLIWNPKDIAQDNEERKRIRLLQLERVLKPAKQYLQFILQRDEFISKDGPRGKELPSQIPKLLEQTFILERDLLEGGEIVETGREEWEVGWLVEKTKENDIQDLVHAFSANSNTLLLSDTVYDGEHVQLKHSNLHFIGQDHSIIIQPQVASNGLFVG
ncbi:hypothetical protein BLNAU_18010 [Blattamonas nauphoetae]|uniref:Uncharacterized protein n=1 Tax=Blattamonas nauphoetae TaxID=2049346 RepID=A0ABQ9X5N9_9EUKA|nr:hypothetical protein BLNAU_18010 [Blattamonas nauphoetae]